ncbi:ATP-binding protein [Ottowia sp.]|uniref:COG4315 family predicted lipoprotein n=1 Tax=Ottowia sp. TaxID=1898956 RepID=UPI0039E3186D
MKTLIAAIAVAAALAGCGTYHHTPKSADSATQAGTPTQTSDGILIGPDGRSLYVFARDVAGSGQSACVAACATNWPPLGVAPNAAPLGDYTIITRADGSRQWAYKGLPLYYFAKDAKPGDRTGDGVGGNWRLARP